MRLCLTPFPLVWKSTGFLGILYLLSTLGGNDISSEDEEQALADEENVEENPTNLLTLDLIETCHRLNSLCDCREI
jgi:hypothetical protein